jgi:hypothetical protein
MFKFYLNLFKFDRRWTFSNRKISFDYFNFIQFLIKYLLHGPICSYLLVYQSSRLQHIKHATFLANKRPNVRSNILIFKN